MAFKLITVLCATLAYANAGLLAQTAYSAPVAHYSSAPAVSHVYSSVAHQPAVLAHAAPVVAAPAYAQSYAVAPAVKTYAAAPVLHAPIAKVAYSPASEVSHVYSSIAAPQYAYSAHAAPQYAYGAHAAPLAIHSPAIGSSQQNTYRSLGGTISTHSKAVNSAFSSDIRSDTRISNNVYTPALATKTIAYQQPAILEQKHIPATVVSHVAFDGIGAHYAW